MTAFGFLSVAPVQRHGMASEVAKAIEALDDFDVEYETASMGTTIEAEDAQTLFEAAAAAHAAVDGDRVSTFLKVDDQRDRDRDAAEKVTAVEEELGRPPTSQRD